MAKPDTAHLGKWNEVCATFHTETDRGAAVLAASYVENQLKLLLLAKATNGDAAKELFQASGPLSSFSQCITCAYAFGFIREGQHNDLNYIRQIRNYFAHHPIKASFEEANVAKAIMNLSTKYVHKACKEPTENRRLRAVYIIACAFFCGEVDTILQGKGIMKPRPKPKS